jgi:predicted PurR-regulated permease PerM
MPAWLRYLLIICGLALLMFFIWFLRSIIAYIVISWVLSLIGDPVVDFLSERKFWKIRIPRALVAALTVLFTWLIIVLAFFLLIPVVMHQANELANVDVQRVVDGLREPMQQIQHFFSKYHLIEVNQENTIDAYLAQRLANFIDLSNLSTLISGITSILGNIFVAVFAISFMTFFFLKEEELFTKMIFTFVPPNYEQKMHNSINSIRRLLSRYFTGLSIEMFLVMLLNTLGLTIIGVNFEDALVIGIFAGFINVIPYVGPLLGIIFGLFMGVINYMQLDFFSELLPLLAYILMVMLIVQVIDNVVFQPFIYSSSINAHPLEIFLVIMIAGTLAGITGMFLAIPGYTVLRVVLKEFFAQFYLVKNMTKNIDKGT